MTKNTDSRTVVHTGGATHKPAEYQGPGVVLTRCGVRLQRFSTTIAQFPTCGNCARKC